MEPHEFLLKHSQELSEKYPGRYVAVVGDNLVTVNNSTLNAFKEAKKKFPNREACIDYIPTKEETVTLLNKEFNKYQGGDFDEGT